MQNLQTSNFMVTVANLIFIRNQLTVYSFKTFTDATCDFERTLEGSFRMCNLGDHCYNRIIDGCDGFVDCVEDEEPMDERDEECKPLGKMFLNLNCDLFYRILFCNDSLPLAK